MKKGAKKTSKGAIALLAGVSLFAFLFAFLSPMRLDALGTDRLIEYDGEIVAVERARSPRRSFQRRIYVEIHYDGGHEEQHSIKSGGDSKQLTDIGIRLIRARGQPVIVSFLPNDHTLAEIRLVSGEILLPQAQLRKSTLFTAWMVGIGGVILMLIMAFIFLNRRMVQESGGTR
ncbi:MAG: hypothetical protein AAFW60_12250 [Pseudomonadota bacterium]